MPTGKLGFKVGTLAKALKWIVKWEQGTTSVLSQTDEVSGIIQTELKSIIPLSQQNLCISLQGLSTLYYTCKVIFPQAS